MRPASRDLAVCGGIGDRASVRRLLAIGVGSRGPGWCGPARAVIATGCAATERSRHSLSGGGRVRCAGAGALKPRGTRRSANRSTGLSTCSPWPSASSSPRARSASAAERPQILSTSSQVPAPTEKLASSARTGPRRLPADISCHSFTKRSSDAGSDHTRGCRSGAAGILGLSSMSCASLSRAACVKCALVSSSTRGAGWPAHSDSNEGVS